MEVSHEDTLVPLDWSFVQIIWLFLSRIFEKAEAQFQADGLGLKQIVLLAILEKPHSPQDLRRMLGGPASTMSNMINDLEKHGLAFREIDPQDRRRFRVHRTSLGDSALGTAISHIQVVLDEAMENCSEAELATLGAARQTLARLVSDT